MSTALMAAFLAVLVFGAIAGIAIGSEHKLRAGGVGTLKSPPRRLPIWLLIIVLSPLPLIIAAHVFSVYAF